MLNFIKHSIGTNVKQPIQQPVKYSSGAWSPIIGIYKLGVPLVQIAGSAEYIFRTLRVFSPTTPAIILFLPFVRNPFFAGTNQQTTTQ